MNDYPRGKLNEDDEGALEMRITVADNTLIIEFAKPARWIGLGKADVDTFIALLTERAKELK